MVGGFGASTPLACRPQTTTDGISIQLVVVGFLEQLDDLGRRLRLPEEVAEVGVSQVPRDALKPPQVVSG